MSQSERSTPVQGDPAVGAAVGPPGCRMTADDLYFFGEGNHYHLFDKLGAHPARVEGTEGVTFAVWAPDAETVSIVGDWCGWQPQQHRMQPLGNSGIWSLFVPRLAPGTVYKYHVESRYRGYRVDKADPFAFASEVPPRTASVVWNLDYEWGDAEWLARRAERTAFDKPMTVYELHLGSWKRSPDAPERFLTYRELADELIPYLQRMNFTHVEFLPPMEHPFYGSWGYQTTGYFAPSRRYGDPQDLMFLIDRLHQAGFAVIFDWVPSHFPSDEHGLAYFDGTHLFEHSDHRLGFHPDWKSSIFNYGRNEVRSFLISSALFWLERYHVDALRVDAVASMLYLDYSRKEGEWIPNRHGGRENLEAIGFLRQLNYAVHRHAEGIKTIAEESTAWPMVSRPTYVGGLGFDMKWDMGWMHDTLQYMEHDPIHRRFHQNSLTFRMIYAFHENFVLPLSHDEVVHGKRSLLDKMPGDYWQKFANLRALYGYMYGQPGKKLLFMGGEIGQWSEWSHLRQADWAVLAFPQHQGLQDWVADLNRVHREEPALHQRDFDHEGFSWVDCNDADSSVLSFLRQGREPEQTVLVICNFTPVPRYGYRVGVPHAGRWAELLNGDAEIYGGSGVGNLGAVRSMPRAFHGRPHSLELTLPPLATIFLKYVGRGEAGEV